MLNCGGDIIIIDWFTLIHCDPITSVWNFDFEIAKVIDVTNFDERIILPHLYEINTISNFRFLDFLCLVRRANHKVQKAKFRCKRIVQVDLCTWTVPSVAFEVFPVVQSLTNKLTVYNFHDDLALLSYAVNILYIGRFNVLPVQLVQSLNTKDVQIVSKGIS